MRGGRIAHYTQRLPIRWPHGERWRGNGAPSLTQHLDIYVVISTSQELAPVMFLISFWLETQQQPELRISKVRKDVLMRNFSFCFYFFFFFCLILYLVVRISDHQAFTWKGTIGYLTMIYRICYDTILYDAIWYAMVQYGYIHYNIIWWSQISLILTLLYKT